jgi:hypothetical protein
MKKLLLIPLSIIVMNIPSIAHSRAVCYQEERQIYIYGDFIKEYQKKCEYKGTSYYYDGNNIELDLVQFTASTKNNQLYSKTGWSIDKQNLNCPSEKNVAGMSIYVNRWQQAAWQDQQYVENLGYTYNQRNTDEREVIETRIEKVWICPSGGRHN